MKPRTQEQLLFIVGILMVMALMLFCVRFGQQVGLAQARSTEPNPQTIQWVATEKIKIIRKAADELESSRLMLEQMYNEINELQVQNDSLRTILEQQPKTH